MAGFLNPLDAAIGDAETTYGLGPGLVNPTSRNNAPGLGLDPIEQQVTALNAKEPGTYAAMTPEEFEAFKQKQAASSPGHTRPFTAGLEAGAIGAGTMTGNFAQALGVKFNNQALYDAGKAVQDASARGSKGLEPRVGSVADVHSFSDAWDYIKFQTGNAIGSSAPSVVTGVLATFVTSNPILGMAAGAAAPSYIQNTGEMYGTLRDSPGIAEQVKAGKLTPSQIVDYSMVAGVPLAALDIAGQIETLGLSKVLGGATIGALKKSITGRFVNSVIRGATAEGGTEGMQQIIQESVAEVLGDKTPASQRVINVLDSAIGGLLGGGAMSGGAHAIQGAAGRRQPAPAPAQTASPAAPAPDPQPDRPAVDPATGARRVYVDTPAEIVPAPEAARPSPAPEPTAPMTSESPIAPAASAPTPPAGPLGRAMERGKASETAAAAEAIVPVGTPVAVSMPGVPPLNVTVQGYHADGMDVIDDSGEVHTLPMNDPDVTVTPLGGTAPLTASEPHPEPLPEPEEATKAAEKEAEPPKGGFEVGQEWVKGNTRYTVKDVSPDGKLATVEFPTGQAFKVHLDAERANGWSVDEQTAPTPEVVPANSQGLDNSEAIEPETVPAGSPVEGGIREAAAAAAPKSRPAPEGEREAKPVPFSFDVAGKKVAFPSDGLASLYDVGQRRNSFRQGGRDTGAADKLIAAERQRTADLLGIPLEDVNKASDEYRHMVEQAAKAGKDEAQVAPTFDPKTLTAARDAWDGMDPAGRKAILDKAGVKRSPKMKWDALSVTIQNKIKPALAEKADTKAFSEESGTLGIPRDEMPQVPTESHGGLVKHLNANGIDHETKMVSADELKPTQAEFSQSKVEAAKDAEGDRAVIVANDGHIIDGHHQALAAQEEGKPVKAIVLDAPVEKALEAVKNSPSAQEVEKAPEQKKAAAFPSVDKTAKWFSTRERAQTSMEKKGLTASHEIVQTQKQRFEIRPKAMSENVEKPEATSKADRPHLPAADRTKIDVGDEFRFDGRLYRLDVVDGTTVSLFDVNAKRKDMTKRIVGRTWFEKTANVTLDAGRKAEKAGATADKWKPIGVNSKGQQLFEDDRGVRSITEGGVRRTEPVMLRPQRGGGMDIATDRTAHPEYQTADEAVAKADAAASTLSDGVPVIAVSKRTGEIVDRGTFRGYNERNGSAQIEVAPGSISMRHPENYEISQVSKPAESTTLAAEKQEPEHPGLVIKSLQTGKETVIQPKGTKPPADKPVYGASNKLVSADRAAEVRAKLKAKLKGQLNSGIDPEVLALGAELAAFHLEAGARKFADVARAVAKDLDTDISSIRKYLRAWYNGARDMLEDSGFDIAGMDTPETVRAQVAVLSDQESKDEPAKLGAAGEGSLEGAPSETVSPASSERDSRGGATGRGGEDVSGVGGARGSGLRPAGSVGDREGEVSLPAGAEQPVRDDKKRQPGVEAERAGDGDGPATRRNEKRGKGDVDPASERIESQVKKGDAPPKSAATPAPQISGNFVIRDEDDIGEGGQRQKVEQNLEAIRLVKQLEQENRPATRAEQAVLAKYVGWGGLKSAFPREDGSFAKGWETTGKELRALLGDEEYKAAASSTQNAHYTSPEIVKAMWTAVRRLGFGGGRVLEPSVGVGNFFGLMPGEIREHAQLTGVEKDWVTGGIAKHLYPHANVQARTGFEQFATPDDYFDLAIGNPPFGSERIFDPNRKHLKFSIHNFFFAKSLDSLRPGGLMAMVVSDSLMDAQRDNARRYLSDRADLVGAVRLPNNAFEKNAGTSVTTDILFLRKRAEGEKPAGDAWVATRTFTDPEGREMPLNEYYHAHPENVLGNLGWYGTMRPEGHSAVVAPEGQDTPALLRDFIARLPERAIEAPGVRPTDAMIEAPHQAQDAVVGSMFMDDDGKVWIRGQDLLGKPQAEAATIEAGRALDRVKGMIGIRDAFADLRKAQLDSAATDKQLSSLRARLNDLYDGFVAKNGPINLDANRRVFQDDPTWPQLSALEDKFDKGISSTVAAKTGEKPRAPSAQKAAIFTRRTQHPYQAPTSAPTAKDALAISQNELGKIDLDYMARLYGKAPESIVQELGPLVFKNPEAGWQAREDYLSGNVKRKLAVAVEAAKSDPTLQRNVEALKEAIPADLNPIDIRVAPGAHWVPSQYVEDFAAHITEAPGAKAFYSPQLARWVLSKLNSTPASEAKWGTQRASVTATLEAAINGRTMTISDRHSDGSSTVNQVATEAANEKVARIRDEWKRWLWQDDARRDALAGIYNDTFNTDQPWEPDGSHLSLPGTIDVIELRPHQKNFIWRVIQKGVALADHVVGAGKTFAVIGSIMEMRRLGLAKKPMLVVPNHLVEQWGADFMRLYPGANILAATKKDFEANNRRRLFARIATGDYDAVIVAHSSFGKIPVDLDYQRQFIESQVADMEASISALREAEGKKTRNVAQLEKARDNLRAKLQRLLEGPGKDEIGLTFQDIGIDAMAVDEAHEFKNLAFSSSMQRVAGLGNQKGSQKAADLYMKTQAVLDKTGGRNIIFATGTPISNTMAEMFTVQRYLDGRRLSDLGLAHFDAWARQFGEIVSDWELSPSGKYKMNSRFAKFVNVPELLRQYKGFADVITRDDIERQLSAQGKTLGIPKMVGGKPQNVIVDRTEYQASYIGVPIKDKEGNETENYPEGSLIYRAEHLPKGPPKKGDDNMLKIMSDARKAALDMRLIDPNYPDPDANLNRPVSKIGNAAIAIKRIYDQWDADKGAQLVFIDLSTPKKAREKEGARIRDLMMKAEQGDEDAQQKLDAMSPDEFDALTSEFSVYDDLRAKLLKLGIPDKQIAYIHDANTDKQKAELFGKVRSGDIRVLLGSTAKMGAGMNVQERLVALHHIDAPWRPSDLEQREGRIIRQGNALYARDPENFEVGVYRYATKNTLDARMWQTIEGKARFIEQLRKGDLSAREIEDVAGEAANAAEMKAAASGNPLILEEMDLRQKVRKLDAARSQHDREQFDIKRRIKFETETATAYESSLPGLRQDAEAVAAMGEKPIMKVGNVEFEKPKEFGDAILVRAAKMIAKEEEQAELGEIGGFPLIISNLGVVHTMNGVKEYGFIIEIAASQPEEVRIGDPKVADATGVAMKLLNTVRKMPGRVETAEQTIENNKTNVEKLRALIEPWGDQDKLDAAEQRHRDVINQLKPKKKDDRPKLAARADALIGQGTMDPATGQWSGHGRWHVVTQGGGQFADYPADGFHTKAAAEDWITDQVEKNGRKESVPADQSATGMTPDEVRAVLDKTELAGPIGRLIDAGRIVIEPIADSDANAYVTDADGVIHLVAPNLRSDGDVTASLLHEAFHSGVRPLIGDRAWTDLLGRLNSLYNQARRSGGGARAVYDKALARMAHAQETSGPFSDELTPEEFGAYMISEHETMPRAFGDWAREVIGAVKAWALRRFGRQIGAVTPDQLRSLAMAAIRDNVAGTAPRGPSGRRESVAAPTTEADRAMPRTVTELSDAVKALSEDQRDKALALLPLNVLPDWAAPNQVAVQQYIDTKRRMDTYRNKKQNAADEIVQRWRKAVGKGGKGAKDLAAVMHEATLARYDPSMPIEEWEELAKASRLHQEPRDLAREKALLKRYQALTPNAQAVYREVRDAYKKEADERDKIILENVSKAMDQELRTAERNRDKDLARIRDEGLTGEEKKEAVKAAEERFTRAQQKLKFSKKARLAALRAAFESNRVPEPYFPLARFGQYFVTARDDLGKVISFSRAETKMQLNRLVRDIRAQLPHANIETGLLEEKGNLRAQMDPRVLADIQAILGNAGVSADVLDQVWQRYLEAMPDLSIRKRSIHRGGVAGFNDDAMRAFASHMFHAAHQMGRVKYGGDMLELVNQATDQAKQAKDPIAAQKIANEIAKRHEWVMNPKGSTWANNATTLGFLYFLGFSPASAAVNLSQTVIMGVPILGSRFGMGKATAALTKASHDFIGGKGGVETSGKLSDLEKTAITELYDRGALDKSMAHDLAGVADQGAGYNPTRQRVMRAMSFLFHHAERFNREVTALAAYRLARQAGLSHGAAVDKAGELTWLTHFDYSNTNRPRVMQNDAAKVILLFKNFQLNSIYRLFRDTQQSFAGDTPQARKEARYQLAGIMGMYALMAGGLGVPLMKQIIIPLWGLMFGNDDDKSAEEEFRSAVLNTLGPQLGGAALDGVPGYLTGTSLTQRIGMGDLWFHSQDRIQTAQDWWNSLANELLGPVWGLGHNIYNGFNVIRDGKGVARGVEMMMPTAAKNLMKAWRYSQEGVVNLRGDTVVPEDSLGLKDALKQAIGFTPAVVAEQYTRNDEKANMDKRITQRRKQLLDGYAKARKAGDEAAMASALADIQKFNAEPTHAAKRITGETIRDSIRTRNRLSNRAENGIIIQNRRQNTLLNERLPPRVY